VREHFERMLDPKTVPGPGLLIAAAGTRARRRGVDQKLATERHGNCWDGRDA
jgi:hypothetical protein